MTLNWNRPGEIRPAYVTVALVLPILTTGSGESVPPCVDNPFTTGWEVGPKPLAYSATVSPGLAGVKVEPRAEDLVGPSSGPSACVAATRWLSPKTHNAGGSAFASAVTPAQDRPGV